MLYNKNQFKKTNDKKVLHKIGKHWVTVSVAFLALLGLGAASTTLTTKADTTGDNSKEPLTSAAPSGSANVLEKQVAKQANALHNQLLGQAAVASKKQPTMKLGSMNGRKLSNNHVKPVNQKINANHIMRLGSKDLASPTPVHLHSILNPAPPVGESQEMGGLDFDILSDVSQHSSANPLDHDYTVEFTGGQAQSDIPSLLSDGIGAGLTDLTQIHGIGSSDIKTIKIDPGVDISKVSDMANTFAGLHNLTNIYGLSNFKVSNIGTGINMSGLFQSDYHLTNISGLSDWDTTDAVNVNKMFMNDYDLRTISDMSNWNTYSVGDASDMFANDGSLNPITVNQLKNWNFYYKTNPSVPSQSVIKDMFKGSNLNNGKTPLFSPVNPNSTNSDFSLHLNSATTPGSHSSEPSSTTYPSDTALPFEKLVYAYNATNNSVTFWDGKYAPYAKASYSALPGSDNFVITNGLSMIAKSGAVSNSDMYYYPDPRIYNAKTITFHSHSIDPINLNNNADNPFTGPFTSSDNANPSDFAGMFMNMPNVTSIDMSSVDGSHLNVSDMAGMFSGDPNLVSVKMPHNMNYTHVHNMEDMFAEDPKLKYIDFGTTELKQRGSSNNWDVTPATLTKQTIGSSDPDKGVNMNGLFYLTPSLSDQRNIKGFSDLDTSDATSMNWMFAQVGLKTLSLPDSFNTKNVTSMNNMFGGTNLTSLDFGNNFDTSKVTDMHNMFYWDVNLNKLKLPNNGKFNTSNVTNMNGMFNKNDHLRKLILPDSFNTQKVSDMRNMFAGMDAKDPAIKPGNPNNSQHNVMKLTLPLYFVIKPSAKTGSMFAGAALRDLTIKNPSKTKFSNKVTKIIPLYQPKQVYDPIDKAYYTVYTPHDFSTGKSNTYTPKHYMPKTLAYSDIYSSIDGNLDWRLIKNNKRKYYKNTGKAPNGWTFIDSDGLPTDDITQAVISDGIAKVAPVYDGFMVKYNAKNKTAEFVDGVVSDQSLANFDNYNAQQDNVNPLTGQITIEQAVKSAHSLTFDGYNPSTMMGTVINNVSDMSNMFANPNLTSVNFNGVFDTSHTTNMSGMFKGAHIANLTLPNQTIRDNYDPNYHHSLGFDTQHVTNMNDMFAGSDGQPSSYLKTLTIPDTSYAQINADAKLPVMYRRTDVKDNNGNYYTEKSSTNFSDDSRTNYQGTYVLNPNYYQVNDTITFIDAHTHDQVGAKLDVPFSDDYAGANYVVTVPSGYDLDEVSSVPSNYHYINAGNSLMITLDNTSKNYNVLLNQGHEVYHVNYYYNDVKVSSDTFPITESQNEVTVNNTNVPAGWKIKNLPSVDLNTHNQPGTVQIVPNPIDQVINYVDSADYHTPEAQKIGSYTIHNVVSSAVASVTGDKGFEVINSADAPSYSLPSSYYLVDPNTVVNNTGTPDNVYIEKKQTDKMQSDYMITNHNVIYYQYKNPTTSSVTTVSSSVADYPGSGSHGTYIYHHFQDNQWVATPSTYTSDPTINVQWNVPQGYHLDPSAPTTVSNVGTDYSIPVDPNTINEHVVYSLTGSPDQSEGSFYSLINDVRADLGNASFEVTSDNAIGLSAGYHVTSNVMVGPASTANSSANGTVDVPVALNSQTVHVDFMNNGSLVSEFTSNGYAYENFSTPLNAPAGYTASTALPASFDPNNPSDVTDTINVSPDQAKDTIQFVKSDGTSVGSPFPIYGNNVTDPNVPNTNVDLTSAKLRALSHPVPSGYVLANNDNVINYDGGSYSIQVVPSTNVVTVNYLYGDQKINSHNFNIATGNSVTISTGNSVQDGIPAGYHLLNETNYDNQNVFKASDASHTNNVPILPDQVSDTIDFVKSDGTKVGSDKISGNDYRATAAGDNQFTIDNDSSNLPQGYYVVTPGTYNFKFDGGTHSVTVAKLNDVDTIDYDYNGKTIAPYQYSDSQGTSVNISDNNEPGMPEGYHLANNVSFTMDNGTHSVPVEPNDETFTITFKNGSNTVNTRTYNGTTGSLLNVNGNTDVPSGYVLTPGQAMNYYYNADSSDNNATLQVLPASATEIINFVYTNQNGQNINEGTSKKGGSQGSKGTVNPSDYTALKPGWTVIPRQAEYNPEAGFTYNNQSINIFVEPTQVTDVIQYVDNATGKLISNDGPYSDTTTITGNDVSATDAGDNSFEVGATPNALNTTYFRVDDPSQVIPFDGQKHVVLVDQKQQTKYSAEVSQAAKTADAGLQTSINNEANVLDHDEGPAAAAAYRTSVTNSVKASVEASVTNSVAGTNDYAEYMMEQNTDSSVASSNTASVAASESSMNQSLDYSIAGYKSSAPASVSASSAAVYYPPYIPSPVSSVASSAAQPVAKPVDYTNLNYPIQYGSGSKPDEVTYRGKQYPLHYRANGKNCIYVKYAVTRHGKQVEKHGKPVYKYKSVVVSTDLPIAKPSSDNLVRAVDRIDFNHVDKHVFTPWGLQHALDDAAPDEVISYHGIKLAVVNDPGHFRYFMVTKNALAHILILGVGHKKARKMLQTGHAYTVYIRRIVAIHGKKANYVRYEFKVGKHSFWVTARDDYTPDAYWQKFDFNAKHVSHTVRVIRNCRLYRDWHYNKHTYVKNLRRGTVLHVKKIFDLGHNGKFTWQTRFQLTNGKFVTANKNFVQIVK